MQSANIYLVWIYKECCHKRYQFMFVESCEHLGFSLCNQGVAQPQGCSSAVVVSPYSTVLCAFTGDFLISLITPWGFPFFFFALMRDALSFFYCFPLLSSFLPDILISCQDPSGLNVQVYFSFHENLERSPEEPQEAQAEGGTARAQRKSSRLW